MRKDKLAVSVTAPIMASAEMLGSMSYDFTNPRIDTETGGLIWRDNYSRYDLYGNNASAPLYTGVDYKNDYANKYKAVVWNYELGAFGKSSDDRYLTNTATAGEKGTAGGIGSYIRYNKFGPNAPTAGQTAKISMSLAFENLKVRRGLSFSGKTPFLDFQANNNNYIFDTKYDFIFNENKWYKFDVIVTVPTEGTDYAYKLYIDNALVTEGTTTSLPWYDLRIKPVQQNSSQDLAYTDYYDDNGNTETLNGTTLKTPKLSSKFYIDDIGASVADTVEELVPASPVTISSENTEYAKFIADTHSLILYAPYNTTVAEYKENVTVNGAVSYDFYKNGEVLEDTDKISGAYVQFVTDDGILYGNVDAGENLYCEYFDNINYSESTEANTMPAAWSVSLDKGEYWKVTYKGGIGDLTANDIAMKTSSEDGALSNTDPYVAFDVSKAVGAGAYNPITFETSFYGEPGADNYVLWLALNENGSRKHFPKIKFINNGTVSWGDNSLLSGHYWRYNEWNRIALTFYPAGYIDFYLNGTKLRTENLSSGFDNVGYIRIVSGYNSTTQSAPEGALYLDNIDVYSGGYQPIQDKNVSVTNNDTSNITIFPATGELYINSKSDFFDISEVVSKLTVNGLQTWKLYKDNTYSEEILNFSEEPIDNADNMILVLTSEDGTVKKYYTLRVSEGGVAADRAEATYSNAKKTVTVQANLQPLFGAEKKLMLVVAAYDSSNNAIEEIKSKVITLNDQRFSDTVDFNEYSGDASNIKVYLWDADTIKPFTEKLGVESN